MLMVMLAASQGKSSSEPSSAQAFQRVSNTVASEVVSPTGSAVVAIAHALQDFWQLIVIHLALFQHSPAFAQIRHCVSFSYLLLQVSGSMTSHVWHDLRQLTSM
jgi:hypothetical protein